MANLERGIRRITLAVSIAVFLIGTGGTVYTVYRVLDYHQRVEEARRYREAAERCELKEAARAKARPPELKPKRDADGLWILPQRNRLLLEDLPNPWCRMLRGWARGPGIPLYGWWLWPPAQIALAGMAISVGLAAVPWGLFYLGRWIAHGFLKGTDQRSST